MAPFQFEVKLAAAVSLRQLITADERCIALADTEQRCFVGDGKIIFILK